MSTLPLTPLNEAWSKPLETLNSNPVNSYATSDMQNSILSDLGMIETAKQNVSNQEPDKEKDTHRNINIKNNNLKDVFKPYSDDYVEMMIYNALNKSDNTINSDLLETIDNIYMLVIILLILVSIDVILRFRITHAH